MALSCWAFDFVWPSKRLCLESSSDDCDDLISALALLLRFSGSFGFDSTPEQILIDCFLWGFNVADATTLPTLTQFAVDLILTNTVPLDGGTLEDLSSLPGAFFRLRLAAREHDLLKTRFLSAVADVDVAIVSEPPISRTVTYPVEKLLLLWFELVDGWENTPALEEVANAGDVDDDDDGDVPTTFPHALATSTLK